MVCTILAASFPPATGPSDRVTGLFLMWAEEVLLDRYAGFGKHNYLFVMLGLGNRTIEWRWLASVPNQHVLCSILYCYLVRMSLSTRVARHCPKYLDLWRVLSRLCLASMFWLSREVMFIWSCLWIYHLHSVNLLVRDAILFCRHHCLSFVICFSL